MRHLLIAVLIIVSTKIFAQNDVGVSAYPTARYDSLRSTYVKTFPDHFFVWPVIKQRRLDFEMESMPDRKESLMFKSNKPYSLGVGMYLFELGFELAFAAPMNVQDKTIYGESSARDVQLNIFGKRFGIDGVYQRYRGFYIDDPENKTPAGQPYLQRGDVRTRNAGVTFNYVFNHQKFSFRSAYNFAERQLRSAGSFLLFGAVNGFQARGDSAILGPNYTERFNDGAAIQQFKTSGISVAPGYTYSMVFNGFFLNGTFALGPSHNWISYQTDHGSEKSDTRINAFIVGRLALGYNGDRFFGGMSFVSQSNTTQFDNIRMSVSSGTFKILVGYRFGEWGILKKRIWDLPDAIF